MKRKQNVMWLASALGLCWLVSCSQNQEVLPGDSAATSPSAQAQLGQGTNDMSKKPSSQTGRTPDDAQKMAVAMNVAQQEYEERVRNQSLSGSRPPSEWPFPNYQSGPLRPPPIMVNFYRINDRYPAYLLCQYDIDEKVYDPAKEHEWFETSLSQVRGSGPTKFPPIRWITIVIFNRGESKGSSTFEQCFKVGKIFKAADVFDRTRNLSELVADAEADRHPFLYDQQQTTPRDQQRWTIVESHAATNRSPASAN